MLTADERAALDELRSHYPDDRAAAVSVMKWLQKRRGWLSDETMRDAAGFLGLPVADLEGLATFYNLLFRRPVGDQVILICDSVSCWMCGYDRVRARLEERLGIGMGETTDDGRYTLLPVVCLGDCDHAPVMLVGDELHRDLTPERVDEIVSRAGDEERDGDAPAAGAAAAGAGDAPRPAEAAGAGGDDG